MSLRPINWPSHRHLRTIPQTILCNLLQLFCNSELWILVMSIATVGRQQFSNDIKISKRKQYANLLTVANCLHVCRRMVFAVRHMRNIKWTEFYYTHRCWHRRALLPSTNSLFLHFAFIFVFVIKNGHLLVTRCIFGFLRLCVNCGTKRTNKRRKEYRHKMAKIAIHLFSGFRLRSEIP